MKNIFLTLFSALATSILGLNCQHTASKSSLQTGDLLFQNLDCGELCDAIEAVTTGVDNKDFSHCAIVVTINDSLKVVEAIGGKVQTNTLHNFLVRSGDTVALKNITVGRVKPEFAPLIPAATAFAQQQVGQPYDDEFMMDNGKWYCSELLYASFKVANGQQDFFLLAPMTFKSPHTKTYFPAWITYYKQLNKPIPEGELGINPGAISRSAHIEIVPMTRLDTQFR
jgi:hypothetical protein